MPLSLSQRLERKSVPIPECGCVIWTGAWSNHGHGQMTVNKKREYTHRISWELSNGPIPAGKEVCHSCDTPSCINPRHLFLGTHKENMLDALKKGRVKISERGQLNHASKLTEEQVLYIKRCFKPRREIARNYGVSQSTIRDIQIGKTWGWLVASI